MGDDMSNQKDYIEIFTDMMSEGFIFIDSDGIIQIYNSKAREIFGIDGKYAKDHRPGRVEDGDIVLIATNALGEDDGGLDNPTLKKLGISNRNLRKGDGLVVISRYNSLDKGDYRSIRKDEERNILTLDKVIDGVDLSITIDFINRFIKADVNQDEYKMDYINSIGFMVILDGKTKELKFYQSLGYTARDESIRSILDGKPYKGKGAYYEELDLIGKDIFTIHRDDLIIKKFLDLAKGKDLEVDHEYNEINGFPTVCTIKAVEKDRRLGAALKVEDISKLSELTKERDLAINKLNRMEKELESENILKKSFPDIIGNSEKMNHLKRLALKASKTNSTILILGESGTGKNSLAKSIHENSKNSEENLVSLNCSSMDDQILELELFGKEDLEGNVLKYGCLERAEGSSLFLDEIGDMGLGLQVKLLEVLQDREFSRLNGREKLRLNTRIITASNKNLEEEVERGNFREDLYYKINVFPIWIPPLRDRMTDLHPLVDYLIPKICSDMGVESKDISSEAINNLLNYNWPGNIRELENILERAINLCEGDMILSKHIVLDEKEEYLNITSLKRTLEYWEKRAIENALDFFNGDKKMAMQALDISKSTMYEKLNKYGI